MRKFQFLSINQRIIFEFFHKLIKFRIIFAAILLKKLTLGKCYKIKVRLWTNWRQAVCLLTHWNEKQFLEIRLQIWLNTWNRFLCLKCIWNSVKHMTRIVITRNLFIYYFQIKLSFWANFGKTFLCYKQPSVLLLLYII